MIFNIQRFSLHDGPGIRTTVFLKGCPLSCQWCHNPESADINPEITYFAEKCAGCGNCARACPSFCHIFGEECEKEHIHIYLRTGCTRCGRCVSACRYGALKVSGEEKTVGFILNEVMKDAVFYDNSGGGVTLSGGEPLFQADFSYALLRSFKASGLHTCVETSGYGNFDDLERLAEYTDIFLYDIKETDAERHKIYTSAGNTEILENLRGLERINAAVILRCPVIPGINDRDGHFAAIGNLTRSLKNILHVDVLLYHPTGISKYARLGRTPPPLSREVPAKNEAENWAETLRRYCAVPIVLL